METKRFMFRNVITAIVLLAMLSTAQAQEHRQSYFADGYHGGVYGHYPLDWYTQFMIDQLAENPHWRIGLEIEPETWDSVRVHTPDAYARWQQVVVGSQVEYTNPGYAQSYLYPIMGESIIRQFQYGMRKLRDHFPTMTFTTYSTEEPCFTSCLPQILAQLGFRHGVLKCPDTCWGGYTEGFGGELVNWIGPDGTSLLSVPRYACEALEENSVWQTKAWKNNRDYLQACRRAGIAHPVGMCYQDAGWKNGPWLGRNHRSEYVRWTDYIEQIADPSAATDYRMSQEDVRVALVWGSQVMQRIGQQVRHAELRILEAECLAAMNYILSGRQPDQPALDEAWRTLLLAQHHDSWIVPYNRLNRRGTWADNIAIWTDETCQRAGRVMATSTPTTPSATTQTYYNTLGRHRRAVVTGRRSDGSVVDFQVALPAFGAVSVDADTLTLSTSKSHVEVKKHHANLENGRYRMTFDLSRGGILTSLYDKQQKREMVDKASQYGFGELRGYFERDGRFRSSTEAPATIDIIKDNAYVQSVCIAGEIAGVPFAQTYTLMSATTTAEPRRTRQHLTTTRSTCSTCSSRQRSNSPNCGRPHPMTSVRAASTAPSSTDGPTSGTTSYIRGSTPPMEPPPWLSSPTIPRRTALPATIRWHSPCNIPGRDSGDATTRLPERRSSTMHSCPMGASGMRPG